MWGKKKKLSNKSPVDGFRPIIVDGKPSCPCLVKMWGIISVIVLFYLLSIQSQVSYFIMWIYPKERFLLICVFLHSLTEAEWRTYASVI